MADLRPKEGVSDELGSEASSLRDLLLRSGRADTPRTAHELVRDVIRGAILRGGLEDGTRLAQEELAEHLKVSTTPVREALRSLAAEGLISLDAYRGATVRALSREELDEIIEIRQVLEPLALRNAQITPELLARVRELHQRMLATSDALEWMELNIAFHMTVYDSSSYKRLATIIRSLHEVGMRYVSASMRMVPELRKTANSDHQAILSALEAGDREEAVAATRRHLMMSHGVLDKTLQD